VLVAAVLMHVAPAFTASNTGAAGGEGDGAISGYRISNVDYVTDRRDPATLAAITFAIEPAGAVSIRVQLTAAGPWYDCNASRGRATCLTGQAEPQVASLTTLAVVAHA
jgi:hypothetical protein